MAKMRGAHSFRPQVCRGPTPPAAGPSPAAADPAAAGSVAVGPSTAAAGADPAVASSIAGDAEGSSSMAPTQRRYHTRAGPTPLTPSHLRPS